MPDQARLTRRTLLKRAGMTGAAIGLGAVVLSQTVGGGDGESGENESYLPGFNDDFVSYSHSGFADATMRKLKARGGRAIRFGIDWGQVQAAGRDTFDWSATNDLYSQALKYGVQMLPTLFGCPEWADPVVTASRWPGNDPELPPDYFRTCSADYDPDFGRFADQALRHFDAFSRYRGRNRVVTGVEILNEPNVWTFGAVPAGRLRELCDAAAARVDQSQKAGAFSGPMWVISGGPAPAVALEPDNQLGYPVRPSWQEYLSELVGDGEIGFDVGMHAYETAKPPEGVLTDPEDSSDPFDRGRQYATWRAERIVEQIDEALEIVPGDLWLTETGASSAPVWPSDVFSPGYRGAHGQAMQAETLTGIADAISSRPRCRSMFVHRLFSDDRAEPPGTAHFQDGVYDSIDGKPKEAVEALAAAWP